MSWDVSGTVDNGVDRNNLKARYEAELSVIPSLKLDILTTQWRHFFSQFDLVSQKTNLGKQLEVRKK